MPLYIWLAATARGDVETIDGVEYRPLIVDSDGLLIPGYAIPSRNAPAADTNAVITIAAVANTRHYLDYLHYHYSAAPAAATVLVENGLGTTVWDEPNAVGPVRITFAPGSIQMSINTALVVSLPTGGSGITGVLKIGHHSLEVG